VAKDGNQSVAARRDSGVMRTMQGLSHSEQGGVEVHNHFAQAEQRVAVQNLLEEAGDGTKAAYSDC
jgi:hypothetical protein